jgi:hypothetical protein
MNTSTFVLLQQPRGFFQSARVTRERESMMSVPESQRIVFDKACFCIDPDCEKFPALPSTSLGLRVVPIIIGSNIPSVF